MRRETCLDCDGSGMGACHVCGDGYTECACPDGPDSDDCDTCGGTGDVPEEDEG